MRERYPFNMPAAGRWPDANQLQQGHLPRFNWVKIDNRGGSVLTVGLGPHPNVLGAGADINDTLMDVQSGQVRVFNVAGPHDDATTGDSWWSELHLATQFGTVGMIEIADHPIVDLPNVDTTAVAAVGSQTAFPPGLPGSTQIVDQSVFFAETTVALGASATFTGPWHDALFFNWFGAVVLTDQTGTLYIDEADASTPTVTNEVAKQATAATDANAPTPPAAGQVARIAPTKTVMRFVRVRFINGATPQTRLNIQSTLSPLN